MCHQDARAMLTTGLTVRPVCGRQLRGRLGRARAREGIGDGEGAAGEEMLMMQRPVRNNEDEMVASRR